MENFDKVISAMWDLHVFINRVPYTLYTFKYIPYVYICTLLLIERLNAGHEYESDKITFLTSINLAHKDWKKLINELLPTTFEHVNVWRVQIMPLEENNKEMLLKNV